MISSSILRSSSASITLCSSLWTIIYDIDIEKFINLSLSPGSSYSVPTKKLGLLGCLILVYGYRDAFWAGWYKFYYLWLWMVLRGRKTGDLDFYDYWGADWVKYTGNFPDLVWLPFAFALTLFWWSCGDFETTWVRGVWRLILLLLKFLEVKYCDATTEGNYFVLALAETLDKAAERRGLF